MIGCTEKCDKKTYNTMSSLVDVENNGNTTKVLYAFLAGKTNFALLRGFCFSFFVFRFSRGENYLIDVVVADGQFIYRYILTDRWKYVCLSICRTGGPISFRACHSSFSAVFSRRVIDTKPF